MFTKIKNLFSKPIDKATNAQINILVVDDNEIDRKVITNILNRQGYNVFTAENGQIGLDQVKAKKPHLVVLDCEMPVMDGVTMCQRLKDDNATMNIPVIFLTSVNTPQNIVDCFELDADNYLSKPVNAKILTSQVGIVLKEYLPPK